MGKGGNSGSGVKKAIGAVASADVSQLSATERKIGRRIGRGTDGTIEASIRKFGDFEHIADDCCRACVTVVGTGEGDGLI